MDCQIRIQMMGNYLFFIDEQRVESPVNKTRKGSALMVFLILNRGKSVPNQRLLRELWPSNAVSNPENALKTLVSRVRTMLNQMRDGLGASIASDRGAYHWEMLEGVRIDALEVMDIFDALPRTRDDDARKALCQHLLSLYKGDLFQTGDLSEEAAYAEQMHRQYLNAVYQYLDLLRKQEAFSEICAVCRTALNIDGFDDRLHIELMRAMVSLNRVSGAMEQYRHATGMTYRYLGKETSTGMQAFYRQLNRSRESLKHNLDAIRDDLRKAVCEREIGRAHGLNSSHPTTSRMPSSA